MRSLMVVVAGLSFVSLVACTEHVYVNGKGTGTTASPVVQMDPFCKGYCSVRRDCDARIDLAACVEQCNQDNAAVVGRVRADVIALVQACFQQSDCGQVRSGTRLDECMDTAARVAPSAAAQAFCSDAMRAYSRCGGAVDHGKCLHSVGIYADGTIGAAASCLSASCSQISPCVEAALGE